MTDIRLSDKDRAFIREQVKAGIYQDADEVVHAGLRLLKSKEGKLAELRRLIQEGVDDVEAGRVYEYATSEDLADEIMRMVAENDKKTGTDH